jgi:hypothetical protein
MRKIKQSHTEHAHPSKQKSFTKFIKKDEWENTRHLPPRGALRYGRPPRLRLQKNQANAPQVEDKNKQSDFKGNHRQKNSINHTEDKGKIRKPPDQQPRATPNDPTDYAPQKDYEKAIKKRPASQG